MTPRNGRITVEGRRANPEGVARWTCAQGAEIAPSRTEMVKNPESGRTTTAANGRGRQSGGGDWRRSAAGRKGIGGKQTP
jgi:hypothetical protein